MDLGQFVRRRWILWGWLVLPVLLFVLTVGSTHFYRIALQQDRAGVQSHYSIIPDMVRSLRDARTALARFGADTEVTFDQLAVMFNEVAATSDWDVVSVRIDEVDPSPRKGLAAHRIIVIGEGPILAAMRYLDQIQSPRQLIEVESAQLKVKQEGTVPRYSGRFVFAYFSLAPST